MLKLIMYMRQKTSCELSDTEFRLERMTEYHFCLLILDA